ncbi:MAG: DNA-binding domain-containing protein [Aestuariivita sp.]|nr:DNA-binding domain-containing protein [Aestuariivita sp.]MCY4346196.1 DNA-binding domain-containing protein [Aestuariivita sp.]
MTWAGLWYVCPKNEIYWQQATLDAGIGHYADLWSPQYLPLGGQIRKTYHGHTLLTVFQDRFFSGLFDPQAPVPTGLLDGHQRPAGKRYNVYRNNVVTSLITALQDGFPAITKLLGEENMRNLAHAYARKHVPQSRIMMHYGQRLPEFIANTKQLSNLPYLSDVARLELELRRSYHAADSVPIDPGVIDALDPTALTITCFELAPSLGLICSSWPIYSIWARAIEDADREVVATAQDVLVMRPNYDPELTVLSSGGAEFVEQVRRGEPLGKAFDAAVRKCQDFCLTLIFEQLLKGGAIISARKEGG